MTVLWQNKVLNFLKWKSPFSKVEFQSFMLKMRTACMQIPKCHLIDDRTIYLDI